jgi:hypothetical protein
MREEVLGPRALNRALLERQLLLRRRADVPVREAVERLVGLQAQAPTPPYYGLWSRLDPFDPDELGRMLTEGEVVRVTVMRGTIHLVTVRDALFLRPLAQVAIERGHNGVFGRRMGGVDPKRLGAAARELLDREPQTAREVARQLIERGIGEDIEAITNAVRTYVAVVQLPPRGVWGKGGQAKLATIEAYTGRELEPEPSLEELVLRYLGGFGPASVMDAQNWSGLTKLNDVFERLRPQLVNFRDEGGRELFDLPGAPRPDSEAPAPVRLLGEYDNVLLGHADRRRIIPPDFPWAAMLAADRDGDVRAGAPRRERAVNYLLVDGMLRATWKLEREGKRRATLAIRPFGKLARAERDAVAAEAERMLAFAAADVEERELLFEDPVG